MGTETILVASGKGGVGKSTIATNLANIFAKNGHKVCIIDLDINLGKIDISLGLESAVEHDISEIILNNLSPIRATIQYDKNPNLFLIPASRNIEDINITSKQLQNIIDELQNNSFEYIILDCPAGVDKLNPFRAAAKCADRALIITNPDKTSLRDADVVISILENNNYNTNNRLHLIINKYLEPKFMSKKKFLKSKEIEKSLAIPLIGVIKHNNNYTSFLNLGEPAISKSTKISSEYFNIYKQIIELKSDSDNKQHKHNIFYKIKKA